MTGWESAEFLQSAVDTCTNASGEIEDCAVFDIQTDDVAATCTFDSPDSISEDDPAGPRDGLAIGVPIQSGPAYASVYSVLTAGETASSAASTTSSAKSSSSSSSSAVVPTLTYSAATASITDKWGGGILVANTATSYEPSSTSTAADSTVTVAASTDDATADDSSDVVATSYVTKDGQVIQVMIEEVDVTVTATAVETSNAKSRRHLEKHQHRRVRHNGRK